MSTRKSDAQCDRFSRRAHTERYRHLEHPVFPVTAGAADGCPRETYGRTGVMDSTLPPAVAHAVLVQDTAREAKQRSRQAWAALRRQMRQSQGEATHDETQYE